MDILSTYSPTEQQVIIGCAVLIVIYIAYVVNKIDQRLTKGIPRPIVMANPFREYKILSNIIIINAHGRPERHITACDDKGNRELFLAQMNHSMIQENFTYKFTPYKLLASVAINPVQPEKKKQEKRET